MENRKKKAVHVTGLDVDLWKAIKKAALDRGVTANQLYLKIIQSGTKRLRIVTERAENKDGEQGKSL
jgi:hypothetical protein